MIDSKRLIVLYGSQTFTAKEISEKIWRTSKAFGFRGPVQPMDDYPISKLIHEEFAIFVCATAGQGEEPDNMKRFWKFLLKKSLPTNSLVKLKFGVLALGDSSFAKFNFVGKKMHKRLVQLGATPLIDCGLCDYQHDLGHDAVTISWTQNFWVALKKHFPEINLNDSTQNKFIPRWQVKLIKDENCDQGNFLKSVNSDQEKLSKSEDSDVKGERGDQNINRLSEDIYFGRAKNDMFMIPKEIELTANVRTTSESHFQDVRLLSFKMADDSEFNYKPGDVLNLIPRNSQEDIDELFKIFKSHDMDLKPEYKLSVEALHEDMPVPEFLKTPLTLHSIAEQYWDLNYIPTRYVFSLLALVSEDKLEKDKCIELSKPEGQEDWLNYCKRPRRTILEVLQDFQKSTSKLTIEILFELFSPIKPRSFSVASSSSKNSKQLDLLVAAVKYYSKLKRPRLGLASNWLKTLKKGDRIFGWIKNGTFVFPRDPKTPCILIGPGTGFAPFRSLLFERESKNEAKKDTMIMFFGCRYKEHDFHCKEELLKLEKEDKLTLFTAFSRDEENKVYVQHKIIENGEFIWKLISDQKAMIFISGNAKNMPDNVKDAFTEVIQKYGGFTLDDSKKMVQDMENNEILQIETW